MQKKALFNYPRLSPLVRGFCVRTQKKYSMKQSLDKLIENTLKDILLGNAALTFIFAIPLAIISKYGLSIIIWLMTIFIAPALCAVGTWLVARIVHHSEAYFQLKWAKLLYVFYTLSSAESLLVYSISQILKNILK